ncbi:zinc finger C2HC domain-containing protein 1C [Mixophyes fleayi]|uniref:zinc finger C2HC domain-containing protein 1C n=1 Tax=Mixophyes fleayi TaxID=3061075 RepID=UPI003F4D9D48
MRGRKICGVLATATTSPGQHQQPRFKMAQYMYPEGLSETKLPTLRREYPASQVPSRLEVLRNEYQERTFREKEEKMLNLLTQQQERISQRVKSSSLYNPHPGSKQKPMRALNQPPQWAQEERMWASNWTVTKRTAGVDRAHPLKPVVHCKAARNESVVNKVLRAPTATSTGFKESLPAQEYVRSKSGPSRTHLWQQLEKTEADLEVEIRRKEALLLEKLRRTEAELRRIQKEKEEAEREDIRARKIEDVNRMRAVRTQRRRSDHYHQPNTNLEEDDDGSYQGKGYLKDSGDKHYGKVETKPLTEVQYPIAKLKHQNQEARATQTLSPSPDGPQASGVSHNLPAEQQLFKNKEDDDNPEDLVEGLVPCRLCGRRFMEHRLEKHAQVCERMLNTKRKKFDSSKARAKGTDLEQYLQKKGKAPSPTPQVKVSSWRQKHESFLRTLQQARAVQNVISRGGKLSDLPPSLPEENLDYVSCPHCLRRFNPRAAERHIPKCETIKSKPRPPPSRRR